MWTDDTAMTIAVAEALIDSIDDTEDQFRRILIHNLHRWGNKYPNAGYGRRFLQWILDWETQPYGSWGNGSAMRVSPVGWMFDTIEETEKIAGITAAVTHDHPEGIKGAQAVAVAIFLARNGKGKEEIRDAIEKRYGYDLSMTDDFIKTSDRHTVSCQRTVPEAICAFLNGNSFVDVIKRAVSYGGDTDTIAAISGSIAEAYYDIPKKLILECEERLPDDMLYVLRAFQAHKLRRVYHAKPKGTGTEPDVAEEQDGGEGYA